MPIIAFSSCRKEDGAEVPLEALEVSNYEAPVENESLQVRRGRDLWFKATIAQYDALTGVPFADVDMIEILSTASRKERFTNWGLINDPECKTGDVRSFGWDICPGDQGPEGLWTKIGKSNYRDPACDLNEVDVTNIRRTNDDRCSLNFGTSAGIIGIRKFPNPAFKKNEEGALPFVIGVSCAFCHAGFKVSDVPNNPNSPKFAELHGLAGNQYLGFGHWPPAHRPLLKKMMTSTEFENHISSINVCKNCKSKKSLTKRMDDINAYFSTNKVASLNQTTGIKLAELVRTKEVGGQEAWEKGKKTFNKTCSRCHSSQKVVEYKKLAFDVCEVTLPKHLQVLFKKNKRESPVLKSIWSHTPFFSHGVVGNRFCHKDRNTNCVKKELSVDARLKRFELAMNELLSPAQRSMAPLLTAKPILLETDLGKFTIPIGQPRNIVSSLNKKKFTESLVDSSKNAKKTSFKDRRTNFESKIKSFAKDPKKLEELLSAYAKCNKHGDKGHNYGTQLSDQEKAALIGYLKTL
jgi:hypothetical protein